MFAVDCPYCQNANNPGARFCADCGAPLHLKPCPKCGKVDDVTVRQCSGCGALFPSVRLAASGGGGVSSLPQELIPPDSAPVSSTQSSVYRAGPLIAVALVAGGLPFLWMNRDLLPQPRAWQAETPKAVNSAPLSAAESAAGPAAEPTIGRPPVAVPALPAQSVAVPVESNAAFPVPQKDSVPAVAAAERVAPHRDMAGKPARTKVSSEPDSKRGRETDNAPKSPPQSPRKCTESLVAVGLCERSQVEQ